MNVRFLNLAVSDPEERHRYLSAIDRVLQHGQLLAGPEVDEFEAQVADHCQAPGAVGVASGSDAIYLALRALEIGPGDEVITSSMSSVATANAIALTGATLRFADVEDDFNVSAETLKQMLSDKVKAVVPVHYGGKMANMPAIIDLANAHDLRVVEDASQAFGAEYLNKKAGTYGDLGAISMNPMKPLAALGEAGVIVLKDPSMQKKIHALRYNGVLGKAGCQWVSVNGRLDTLQAALLSIRLYDFHNVIARRQAVADHYRSVFGDLVVCPDADASASHVYYTFTIRSEARDALKAFLERKGIEVKIYHLPIPDEPVFEGQYACRAENARRLGAEKLALPCNEKLTEAEIAYVAKMVRRFFVGDGAE